MSSAAGISSGWRQFGDIGECQNCEILQIVSKYYLGFPKRYHRSPKVLRVSRNFIIFWNPRQYSRGPWHMTQKSPSSRCFPQILSPSCGEVSAGFAICSPNKQISSLQFADWSPRSPNVFRFRFVYCRNTQHT